MSTRGEDIRRERMGRGWSQAELARRAGVSVNTVNRIETSRDYSNPRLLPRIERALSIGDYAAAPPERPAPDEVVEALKRATAAQFAAELTRRLGEHEQLLLGHSHIHIAHDHIHTAEPPEELLTRPNVGLGPRAASDDEAQGDA